MTGMRDYILYLQNKQTQDPEWKAALHYQNRNQTKVHPTVSKVKAEEPTEIVIDETPSDLE